MGQMGKVYSIKIVQFVMILCLLFIVYSNNFAYSNERLANHTDFVGSPTIEFNKNVSIFSIMNKHKNVEPYAVNISSNDGEKSLTGKVNAAGGLKLRKIPSVNGEILEIIPNGTTINIIYRKGQWYLTTYQSKTGWILNNYVEEISGKVLSGKIIVIDPGHGGVDTGAIGYNQSYEKDNTLAIALAVKDVLEQAGAKVFLTRESDISLSPTIQYSVEDDLLARSNFANQNKADLFISIHNDSFSDPNVQGTSVYFSDDNINHKQSFQLASTIQSELIDINNTKDLGVKETEFNVLNYTTMPSVLIEVRFISNPHEEARLRSPTFQKKVAKGIFWGIYDYFNSDKPEYEVINNVSENK